MENIESLDVFEQRTAAAGLGPIAVADLELLKRYYDGATAISNRLSELVRFDDEPATTFHAGWIYPLGTKPDGERFT